MSRGKEGSFFDGIIPAGAVLLVVGASARYALTGSLLSKMDVRAAMQSEFFSNEHLAALSTVSAILGWIFIGAGIVGWLAKKNLPS